MVGENILIYDTMSGINCAGSFTHLRIENTTSNYRNENGNGAVLGPVGSLSLNHLTISNVPRGMTINDGSFISVSNAIITNTFVDYGVRFEQHDGIARLFMENVSISYTRNLSIQKYSGATGRANIGLNNVTADSLYFIPVSSWSSLQNILTLTNSFVDYVSAGPAGVVLQDHSKIHSLTCYSNVVVDLDQTSSIEVCSSSCPASC